MNEKEHINTPAADLDEQPVPPGQIRGRDAMMMSRKDRRALGKLNRVKIPGSKVPAKKGWLK